MSDIDTVTKPLSGQTVLVTRPLKQADKLINLLQAAGATVLHQPAITIKAVPEPVFRQSPAQYNVIIFISQNAVHHGLPLLPHDRLPAIAAIGKATTQVLQQQGIEPVISPQQGFTSEDLLALEPFAANSISGKSVLIIRGGEGRKTLKEELQQRGARVDYCNVYQRQAADKLISDQHINTVSIVTVSSQQGLENLLNLYKGEIKQKLLSCLLVVPGERCRQAAINMGFNRVVKATDATDDAALNAIIDTIA